MTYIPPTVEELYPPGPKLTEIQANTAFWLYFGSSGKHWGIHQYTGLELHLSEQQLSVMLEDHLFGRTPLFVCDRRRVVVDQALKCCNRYYHRKYSHYFNLQDHEQPRAHLATISSLVNGPATLRRWWYSVRERSGTFSREIVTLDDPKPEDGPVSHLYSLIHWDPNYFLLNDQAEQAITGDMGCFQRILSGWDDPYSKFAGEAIGFGLRPDLKDLLPAYREPYPLALATLTTKDTPVVISCRQPNPDRRFSLWPKPLWQEAVRLTLSDQLYCTTTANAELPRITAAQNTSDNLPLPSGAPVGSSDA